MSESIVPFPDAIHWFEYSSDVPPEVVGWLLEMGSMTRRFEQHCAKVSVTPQREGFISREELSDEEAAQLPPSERYWLREVVLFGDEVPWLLGRTVIPVETLTGPDHALVDLGTLPLGRYLFSGNQLSRDYIHLGQQAKHWARRSRLRLSDKPLLLTEIFLTASPVYQSSNKAETGKA
ncbi:chorismate lyase [Serratia sp. M24T3]|uniref:chorismate lyase n=1 Tax=Serratia sp. M24T3 TaxID=932213 RepID=UPI00025BBAEA|nr:chorismate lyase [Serratia sp. M24T3]EIC82815.1 chorismate pyruvate lyase [Serratia sp. M24T3]